ncbi:MAG: PCYCGC motif-containing (lipo)protein [Thermoleophilia bacterium]|nr:PCYCGC motif-containing (lipo)protein [Thermoleophilia bacterium]
MAKNKKKPAGGKAGGGKGASSSALSIGIFAALIIVVGVLGGVMGWVLTRGGDEASTGGVKLPDYVNGPTVPKGTAEAYQFAVDNQDVLKFIPCYCGCGELDGHTSNLDCFIASGSGDDLVFDKHAAG